MVVCLWAILSAATRGQEADPFEAAAFDPAVPAPADVVGHALGAAFTPHHSVVAYMQALARTSPRANLVPYGETYEGRELLLLVLTDPERMSRLDETLADLARLADPRRLEGADVAALLDRLPVVVWLSYNVHGDESSGTEAALAVAHRLAAGTDPDTRRWLADAIVVVDPCLNPDGRQRYVSWYRSIASARPDPDPATVEHAPPWPGGRTNHYWFDLNRDWTWLTQVETRTRIEAYRRFEPHVHVDAHEMSFESSTFFFPAARPFHALIPRHVRDRAKAFGDGNAAAYDRRGWAYYTEETFDLFYPGYGDSWPSLRGGVGMTYEQAGGGEAGLAVRRSDGRILTLAERIDRHRVASLATIDTACRNRRGMLADFHRFRKASLAAPSPGETRAWLLPPGEDPSTTTHLVATLVRQGVEVRRATSAFYLERVRDASGTERAPAVFEAGTWIVPAAQPVGTLARSLLEPKPRIPEAKFYDISAWSLPYSFGVEAFQATTDPEVAADAVTEPPRAEGKVEGGPARYAYLVPWPQRGGPRLLYRLLAEGFRGRATVEPFRIGATEYRPGTAIFLTGDNPSSLHERMATIAADCGVRVAAVDGGRTASGIDLGSEETIRLSRPRIAILSSDDVDANSLGTIRFLLEVEHEIDFRLVGPEILDSRRLGDFDVLIIADGSWDAEEAKPRLDRWIEDGGVVVAIEGGTSLLGVSAGEPDKDDDEKDEEKPKWVRLREREREDDLERVPGTILAVELDPDDPLAFGLPARIPVLKRGRQSFPLDTSGTPVGVFTGGFTLGGYIEAPAEKAISDRAWLVHQRRGEGHVVLFSDDPNFRNFWKGPSHLFLAALFFLERPPRE